MTYSSIQFYQADRNAVKWFERPASVNFKTRFKRFQSEGNHEEISTKSRLICRHHMHFTSEWWSGSMWYMRHNISQRCSLSHTMCVWMTGWHCTEKSGHFSTSIKTWDGREKKKKQESRNNPWEKQMFPLPRWQYPRWVCFSLKHSRKATTATTHPFRSFNDAGQTQTVSTCSRNIMPYKCIYFSHTSKQIQL